MSTELKNILIVKTSSMGDVIHTFPAINDVVAHYPNCQFHWVVEAPFAEIPTWHPNVTRVIPVKLRQWRKRLFSKETWREWRAFKKQLRGTRYDAVIDAQGLIKSAYLAKLARGKRYGFNRRCVREPLATRFYHHHFACDPSEHAVNRTRQLFSQIFDYSLTECQYGLRRSDFSYNQKANDYCVFLHGTTWETKHWPERYWQHLAKLVTDAGWQIEMLWGNEKEKQRADAIAASMSSASNASGAASESRTAGTSDCVVHPRLSLSDAAGVIANAKFVVSVDTGLGHLAAALGVPTVSLYGPTNPNLTGTIGENQFHFQASKPRCAPCLQRVCTFTKPSPEKPACFSLITPAKVWAMIKEKCL